MPDDGKDVLKDLAGASASVVDVKALNLHQRLLAVMGDVSYIQKDRKIDQGGGYKVVTHDAVTAKVRPALLKHRVLDYPQNLVCAQNGNRTEMTMDIKFVNADQPDDFILVPTVGYGIDSQDKGPGKAMSYAVKMALLKALNLETGEDADDNTNVEHAPEPPPPKSPPGISAAKVEVREAIREINACADEDSFKAFLMTKETRALAVKICGTFPQEWIGPEEFSGLRGSIEKAGKELGLEPWTVNWLTKAENIARGSAN